MNDLTPAILEALDTVMKSHIGRESALKFAALKYQVNRALYDDGIVVGERVLRGIIESQRPQICFCTAQPGGYFLPSPDADIRRREVGACVNSLNGYISGAAKRKAAILNAYPDLRQGELPL
jgi:hypothetical protein